MNISQIEKAAKAAFPPGTKIEVKDRFDIVVEVRVSELLLDLRAFLTAVDGDMVAERSSADELFIKLKEPGCYVMLQRDPTL